MSAQALGQLQECNPDTDLKHVENAGIFLEANKVPMDKRSSFIFLIVAGKEPAYSYIVGDLTRIMTLNIWRPLSDSIFITAIRICESPSWTTWPRRKDC